MSFLSRSAFLAAAGLTLGACADDHRTGRVDLSLTGRATSGATYRLRDAQLVIEPTGQTFYTEDDPDRAVISTSLEAGLYTLTLAPGWRLERVSDGTAETVFAIQTSPNPLPFDVFPGEITPVRLSFRADNHDVVTGPGAIDIAIDVDDGVGGGADGGVPPPPDAPLPTETHQYVVSRVELPTGSSPQLGLDVDGDGRADNRLASVLAAFSSQATLDLQAGLDRGVARGEAILLAELTGALGADPAASFAMHQGIAPLPAPCAGPDDDVCGQHLQGTGSFQIAPTSPPGVVTGSIVGGRFVGGPGALTVQLPIGPILELPLTSARAELDGLSETGIATGIIGGALSTANIDTHLIPFFTTLIQDIVARDCTGGEPPDCGCAAGSTGRTALGLFDYDPLDCQISRDEISSSSLVRTLLSPDLDVAPRDGVLDSLSVGFGVTAVRASWPR